jgi:hypothetical protein
MPSGDGSPRWPAVLLPSDGGCQEREAKHEQEDRHQEEEDAEDRYEWCFAGGADVFNFVEMVRFGFDRTDR